MKMAIENIEKILLKLYWAGSCYVWQTVKGGTPGILPKYGYISNVDSRLGWELESSQDQSQAVRHMKFVDLLFNAMGTTRFPEVWSKIRLFTLIRVLLANLQYLVLSVLATVTERADCCSVQVRRYCDFPSLALPGQLRVL